MKYRPEYIAVLYESECTWKGRLRLIYTSMLASAVPSRTRAKEHNLSLIGSQSSVLGMDLTVIHLEIGDHAIHTPKNRHNHCLGRSDLGGGKT